ncbi:hypothetical protein J4N42_07755 [Vibrio sp. SCSIO 43135]|uniref:hypothetical protein n=1 Tax=Vibrio sp. SCSIO 43135 TaxID=2819096 RepID=UPI002076499B|nr:hypothetical protein [Vibrio sp. SCSIO 43135]USD39975.1 hypothetical protein J4N42_07755 [Vibrio sp. SCSIO 43135]
MPELKLFIVLCGLAFSVHSAPIKLQASCNLEAPNSVNYFSITFQANGTARVEVNSNQIYVIAKEVKAENYSEFFYQSVDTVGRAGAYLNWNGFSTKHPMFTLERVNERDFVIHWKGFWDRETVKYTWNEIGSKGPDLYSESSVLQNCAYY